MKIQKKKQTTSPLVIGLVSLLLLAMVPMTVFFAQQQQTTKQHAAFEAAGPCPQPITDYPTAQTTCLNGVYCVAKGTNGVFDPYSPTVRIQAVALITRYHVNVLHDWTWVNPPKPSFPDVPTTRDLYVEVETAKANGFITGNGGNFFPDDPWTFGFHGVTRTDNYNGPYNFTVSTGNVLLRGDFLNELYKYGLFHGQVPACLPPTPTNTPAPQSTTAPAPTATTAPTAVPTPLPNTVRFTFTLKLHGIGNAGDTVNPGTAGNLKPFHTARPVTGKLYDVNNNMIPIPQTAAIYDPGTGFYKGYADMPATFPEGYYIVTLKTDNFLHGRVGGIVKLVKGTNLLPPVDLVAGDANQDDQLDITDYNLLRDCFSDIEPAKNCDSNKKAATDLNDDDNVNNDDLNLLIREFSVIPAN